MTIDEAVKNSGFKNPLDGGSRKYAQQSLFSDETLLFAYNCNYSLVPTNTQLGPGKVLSSDNKKCGVFAVTDKRIFICNNVMGQSEFKEIALNQIQSIDDAGNAIIGTSQLRIKGLTEIFIIDLNRSQRKHLTEVKEIISSASNKQQSAPAAAPAQDIPEQLEKYKELLDKGVITQEDFEAKKRQLLGL